MNRLIMFAVSMCLSLSVWADDFTYSGHEVTIKGVPSSAFGTYNNYAGSNGQFSLDGTTYHFGKNGTVTVNWAKSAPVKADWGFVRTKDGSDFMRIATSPGKPEFVGAYILAIKMKGSYYISKFYYLPESNEIWESSARYQMMKKQ